MILGKNNGNNELGRLARDKSIKPAGKANGAESLMVNESDDILQLAGQVQALRNEAVTQTLAVCQPEVREIFSRKINDSQRIERVLDQLLEVAFDETALTLFKTLCRHYWFIDPHAATEYVRFYREMWDEESLERKPTVSGEL
ncbi:MAG: hypothetical protein KJ950_16210 [Proteobacteria bacterium]|nr:hypothetical protein [Pseudomonadota bacterium]MBU1685875.1 hypothetical protein [Pseudomonadota bacterium]